MPKRRQTSQWWSLWSRPHGGDHWYRISTHSLQRGALRAFEEMRLKRPDSEYLIESGTGTEKQPRSANPGKWSAYRPLGSSGSPYPAWVQETRERNGVYAIRHGAELVYVGESHSDRLYQTLTRHFQRWECDDQRCNTYPRSACTVSVLYTSAAEAQTVQAHTILERQPRDNVYETEGDTDATPF